MRIKEERNKSRKKINDENCGAQRNEEEDAGRDNYIINESCLRAFLRMHF